MVRCTTYELCTYRSSGKCQKIYNATRTYIIQIGQKLNGRYSRHICTTQRLGNQSTKLLQLTHNHIKLRHVLDQARWVYERCDELKVLQNRRRIDRSIRAERWRHRWYHNPVDLGQNRVDLGNDGRICAAHAELSQHLVNQLCIWAQSSPDRWHKHGERGNALLNGHGHIPRRWIGDELYEIARNRRRAEDIWNAGQGRLARALATDRHKRLHCGQRGTRKVLFNFWFEFKAILKQHFLKFWNFTWQ